MRKLALTLEEVHDFCIKKGYPVMQIPGEGWQNAVRSDYFIVTKEDSGVLGIQGVTEGRVHLEVGCCTTANRPESLIW